MYPSQGMKEKQSQLLVRQIEALIEGEKDMIAVMSNVAAAIHQTMGFWWTGVYRVVGDDCVPHSDHQVRELVLGLFQGPVACMHIPFGKGVCGTAWKQAETVIVPDVEQFPGHIACSSESKSEIVVPVFGNNKTVVAVLDIDSEELDTFDETDRKYLEEICKMIELNL